uniref:Secreted protein n=1 Tax=Steinernema glaseri TaxID=37863 RepID=A0A1I7YA61_9BILA
MIGSLFHVLLDNSTPSLSTCFTGFVSSCIICFSNAGNLGPHTIREIGVQNTASSKRPQWIKKWASEWHPRGRPRRLFQIVSASE